MVVGREDAGVFRLWLASLGIGVKVVIPGCIRTTWMWVGTKTGRGSSHL